MKRGFVSLLALSTAVMIPPSVSAETLEEALAAAYMSNPQLMAQRAALRATDEGVSSAKAGFLPSLSGSYNYSETDQKGVSQNSTNESYGLTASQNLFNGFQDKYNVKQAKSTVHAGRAQLQSVEQSILQEAVTAYMNVVRDEAVVELNKNNIKVLERQLQASNDRFRVGEVTRTDVAQSEARLENAKATLLSAEATLASSRAQYQRVVGRTPASLETPGTIPELPESLDSAIEIAMELSPGVKAARYNEEAARYNMSSVKGSLLPSVDLSASYTSRDTTTGFTGLTDSGDDASIGVNVSVPLYAGGARYSGIRRAKQLRSQAMMQIHQAERVAQENVFVAWDNYRASVGRITATEASVRANEIALEGVKQEAYVGSRTTLDVLNAEQELLNARVSLVRAERDEYVAAYGLVASVGRLTARDLHLGVDLYDAEEYYDKVGANKFIGFGTDVD